MKTYTRYEWCREGIHYHFDGYGTADITLKDYAEKLVDLCSHNEMFEFENDEEVHDTRVCLIRLVMNDDEDILKRSYCYAEAHKSGGFLPEEFPCGTPVPKKFQKEFDSWKKTQNK